VTCRAGFRERLMADSSFFVKVAIECGIGIFTKCAAEYEKRKVRLCKLAALCLLYCYFSCQPVRTSSITSSCPAEHLATHSCCMAVKAGTHTCTPTSPSLRMHAFLSSLLLDGCTVTLRLLIYVRGAMVCPRCTCRPQK
jgi:Protein RETICULATA-related